MNNFKQIKKGLLFVFAAFSISSCVHDDDYAVPPIENNLPCKADWVSNTNIADLIAMNPSGEPMEITEDIILEGYVVSSDQKGNFFKSLVIQDSPENPSYGMSIEFDLYDTYRKFPVGYKVLVNAKGLYFGMDRATYKIGSTYADNNGNIRVGRMTEGDALDKVALSCEDMTTIVPDTYTSIQDFKDQAVVNTLVKLENVQFDDITEGDTYYDANSNNTFGGATNRTLIDEAGNTIVLRTSQYTDFAGETMPTGSGSIIAVLSAYSNNNNPTPSTYQLFLRDISDVNMNEPRFGDAPTTCQDPWEVNTTLAELKGFNNTATPLEITDDVVFAGYVVSNDQEGNFYKTLSIQDNIENPTAGISIEMNINDIYQEYPVGSKILVNAKGMFVAKDRGTYKVGATFDDNGTLRVGRLSEDEINTKIAKSCAEVVEIIPTKFTSISDAMNENLINTLITLEGVQFTAASNGATYYMGEFSGYNQELVDSQGNVIVLRTSKYADFADEVLPTGTGNITVVLSAYAPDNVVDAADFQLYIRDTSDVDMN